MQTLTKQLESALHLLSVNSPRAILCTSQRHPLQSAMLTLMLLCCAVPILLTVHETKNNVELFLLST